MRIPGAVVVVLFSVALAGCGNEASSPEPDAAAPGEWTTEHLAGEPAVDFPTVLATDADDALVLMVSDDGMLRSHLSLDGGAFQAGEPLDTGSRWIALGGAVRFDGDWYALGSGGMKTVDGDEEMLFEPVAFRSADGLVWESVEVAGFTDATDVSDLAVVDGRLVVAGSYRTEESMGGFEARVWVSEDGARFDEVALPDVLEYHSYDDESSAGHLAVVGSDLLAAGRIGDDAALWRSEDDGATWSRVDPPALRDAYSVAGLRVDGSTVVATVSADTLAIRSTDGGRTWEPVAALPVNEEADGWAPLWSGAGQFFTLTGVDDQSWSRPEVCYADLGQCGRNPGPQVVTSGDGLQWSAVALPGDGEADEIAGTEDGRLLVMTAAGGGIAVHTWPAGSELPAAEDPAVPETVKLVTVPEGEEPEVGVRYHAPMYVHCGADWLWFGDATWRRTDDGPGVETGAGESAPDEWPLVEQQQTVYGYATVLPHGTLEYSNGEGTVIATYERRSGAPGCD